MQQLSVLLRGSLHMCVLAAPQRSSLAALSSPSAQRQPAAFCSLCAAAAGSVACVPLAFCPSPASRGFVYIGRGAKR
jgi:hypothetical protein